jgi:hypothetical protein
MTGERWKELCMAAANQPGYVPKTDRPMVLSTFQCDRCEMVWMTGMKLEGEPHKALMNQCGGMWRGYTAKAVESSPPPLKEEYEIDDTV